jgi:hypothetical protein
MCIIIDSWCRRATCRYLGVHCMRCAWVASAGCAVAHVATPVPVVSMSAYVMLVLVYARVASCLNPHTAVDVLSWLCRRGSLWLVDAVPSPTRLRCQRSAHQSCAIVAG